MKESGYSVDPTLPRTAVSWGDPGTQEGSSTGEI